MGCTESRTDLEDFKASGGEIHMLIIALDYTYSPGNELTATLDADRMVWLGERAGVKDITVVTDKVLGSSGFPTRQKVLQAIKEVSDRCHPGDWFIFFYSGHGMTLPDATGDEVDGTDEAFVTPDQAGKIKLSAVLIDDDFAKMVDHTFQPGVRLLCICDCCHSGTICDVDTYHYTHEIYQIAAAQDNEEAVDTGRGGALSEALTKTVMELTALHGTSPYSIKDVYDGAISRVYSNTTLQHPELQFSGVDPGHVAWPLSLSRIALLQMASKGSGYYEKQ